MSAKENVGITQTTSGGSRPTVGPTEVRPFSCGTEGYDWLSANCDRCTRNGPYDASGKGPCPMETAVSIGFVTGTVPAALATEFGAKVRGAFATMPRQCARLSVRMVCESVYRRAKKGRCGEPATEVLLDESGYNRAVCKKHAAAYRRMVGRTPVSPTVGETEPASDATTHVTHGATA